MIAPFCEYYWKLLFQNITYSNVCQRFWINVNFFNNCFVKNNKAVVNEFCIDILGGFLKTVFGLAFDETVCSFWFNVVPILEGIHQSPCSRSSETWEFYKHACFGNQEVGLICEETRTLLPSGLKKRKKLTLKTTSSKQIHRSWIPNLRVCCNSHVSAGQETWALHLEWVDFKAKSGQSVG